MDLPSSSEEKEEENQETQSMQISVNGQEILSLSPIQIKVICNDIRESEFEEDIKRRISHIVLHKYDQCMKRMKEEWLGKLESRYDMIPSNADAFANLVFSQEDYKCRQTRDTEELKRKQEEKVQSN